jgi:serine/threonine protein kinase
LIGEMLDHYQILEKLGEGGMGVVYKARDTHLDRFVAIKVLPEDKVADAESKRRFVQEAKAASALNHPNIVTIHDINEADGIDYIAMEYIAGRSRAHGASIIHRDLKPSNVMVDEHGLVKVLDFGLAKLAGSPESLEVSGMATVSLGQRPRTESDAVVGTVAYMSPEQSEGRPVDTRSDILSFGIMLYEMTTGQRPFRGDSHLSILSATLREDPAPPRQLVAELLRRRRQALGPLEGPGD